MEEHTQIIEKALEMSQQGLSTEFIAKHVSHKFKDDPKLPEILEHIRSQIQIAELESEREGGRLKYIRKGKRMRETGIPAIHIQKYIRSIESLEGRHTEVLDEIFDIDRSSHIETKDKLQVEALRSHLSEKDAVRDFARSNRLLRLAGVLLLFVGSIMCLSVLLAGSNNIPFALLNLSTGFALLLAHRNKPFILLWGGKIIWLIYGIVLATEIIGLGLPNRLIPGLFEGNGVKVINVISLFNDLSPLIYLGLKIALLVPLVQLSKNISKMERIKEPTREKLLNEVYK